MLNNNRKQKYVYMIQIDYKCEDAQGVDTILFSSRKKAEQKLKAIIEEEKTQTWAQDAFTDGKVNEGYEFSTNIDFSSKKKTNLWWTIEDSYDWNYYTNITLKKLSVE